MENYKSIETIGVLNIFKITNLFGIGIKNYPKQKI
ncbi:hypothetical protein CMTB2_01244 [Caminibacter mediatlanticus TB-2]|uniref:Uncharacterized protein n=1 Tax=Caminibacter mediatlanticus TB-2 TaxID=391592 RepID=A0AAI9AHY8_9BACT|nr:hypothetical protein CMTB2_01244 [Caminibacter mediatlanticus TB-2]